MIRGLVAASMSIAVALIALVCAGVDPGAIEYAGGVAHGLYGAAFAMWLFDPETTVSPFSL